MKNKLFFLVALGGLAASLRGQDIFDPFNYAPGVTLAGQSPFAPLTWVAAGPAGPQQARVQAGVLQWPGLSNSVPNRVNIIAGNGPSSLFIFGTADPADPYLPITGGTIYFSFLLRVTDLTGLGAGNYFAGFTPDQAGGAVAPANVFTRVLLRASGAGYNIGLVKSSAAAADFQWNPRVFNSGETVLIVGDYIFSSENADVSQLWINPDPTTFCSPTPPLYTLQSAAGPDATQLASVVYIQRPTPAQPTALLTDELRISRFWDGVVRPGWDYGDAPPPYRTLYADNGARHTVVPNIYMGSLIDVECDGFPSVLADGDDTNNLDDGDGVTWAPGPWILDSTRNITVTVSVDGKLDAFFDWHRNGDWADAGEHVFSSQPVFAGANALMVTVPPGAVAGPTYARFRFSTAGGLGATGPAPDGETEDYRIQLQAPPLPPDLGVAVLVSPQRVTEGDSFTSTITVSNNGPSSATGVQLTSSLPSGVTVASISNSAGACQVQGSNIVCTVSNLAAQQSFNVQAVFSIDARILDEIEDFEANLRAEVSAAQPDLNLSNNVAVVSMVVASNRDFGDAPSPPYPTCLPNGARHRVQGNYRMGLLIDAEADCQPDDNAFGTADEDGATFAPPPPWAPGTWVTPTVTVARPAAMTAVLDAWLDADGVPGFNPADRIYTAQPLPLIGPNVLPPFQVPPTSPSGGTWARFRMSQAGVAGPGGFGGRGEVEDYPVPIQTGPNDNPVYFAGLLHTPQGGATLNVTSNGLEIANLGSSNGAVRISLGRSQGWSASIRPVPVAAQGLVYSVNIVGLKGGQSNQPLGSLRLERQGSNNVFSADFSSLGASQYATRFYDGTGRLLVSLPPRSFEQPLVLWDCDPGERLECEVVATSGRFSLIFCHCVKIVGPDIDTNVIDRPILCEIAATDPAVAPDAVTSVEISGGTELTLQSEALRQFGLWNHFLGNAKLHPQESGGDLIVAFDTFDNGAAVLEDGLETIVGGTEYIGELPAGNLLRKRVVKAWTDDWGKPWLTSSNGTLRWTATGRIQGSVNSFENLGDLSLLRQERGTELSATFAASLRVTDSSLAVFNGPEHVGTVTLPVGVLGSLSPTVDVSRVVVQVADGALSELLTTRATEEFVPADGSPALSGDRFRITALNPQVTVEGLRSLITRVSGVESIGIKNIFTATPQRPRMTAPRRVGNRFELTFPTEPDVVYDIEKSADLISGSWTPIGTAIGTDGVNTTGFLDDPLGRPIGWYRIRVR
jgi:uncharacterized repeat protein (TIGR01451 family)